jgi:MinD superfamily P-loop ATPase
METVCISHNVDFSLLDGKNAMGQTIKLAPSLQCGICEETCQFHMTTFIYGSYEMPVCHKCCAARRIVKHALLHETKLVLNVIGIIVRYVL